ncbi:MAG: poly-gamma-glutamate system protein [Nitrospirota bacterium]
MKWRSDKASLQSLLFITVVAVLALVLAETTVTPVREPHYTKKLQAAKNTLLAQHTLRTLREGHNVVIDPVNDPNGTGLIGSEFTLITTDRGDITSKLTSTNPNFAAAIVHMLTDAKLKKGDVVAVALTGSFPALNIATLAALEALDLVPIVVTSVGSSSWGATDPGFTWLDMERALREAGVLHTRSVAASIGGGKDTGRGLSPEGRQAIEAAIARNDAAFIKEDTVEASIEARLATYDRHAAGKPIKAFVNVGGGIASLGNSINGTLIPAGLSTSLRDKNFPMKGVLIRMADRGMPVIHILDVQRLAKRYGLPLDPVPLPELGQGPIYFKERYDRVQLGLIIIALVILTAAIVRLDMRHYLQQIRLGQYGAGGSTVPPAPPPKSR